MSGLPLRSGPSGPKFVGPSGYVMTLDPSGDTWSPQPPGSGGGVLISFNGRTTPAAVPATNDYSSTQVQNLSSVGGVGVTGALDTLLTDIGALTPVNPGTVIGQLARWNGTAWVPDVVPNAVHANGNSGAALAIDARTGELQTLTLTANCTVTVSNLPAGVPAWLQLDVLQDGTGTRTLTITGAKTPGGAGLTLSTAANALDLVSLSWDGTTLYAIVGGASFA